MPPGERLLCRTAAWGVLVRPLVPWALSGESLDGEVLEIGGGGGAMAAGVLNRFASVRITIADLDPKMVQATGRRLARFGDRARAEVGDATALPFPDARFDSAISFLMLHHVGRWEAAVAEAARVLRPGGRFLGYDLHDTAASRGLHHADGIHDLRSITAPTMRAALHDAGFLTPRFRQGRLTVRWVAVRG
jgi:ubiquinone/menaquinone biosynthesis C-methylase UbiE